MLAWINKKWLHLNGYRTHEETAEACKPSSDKNKWRRGSLVDIPYHTTGGKYVTEVKDIRTIRLARFNQTHKGSCVDTVDLDENDNITPSPTKSLKDDPLISALTNSADKKASGKSVRFDLPTEEPLSADAEEPEDVTKPSTKTQGTHVQPWDHSPNMQSALRQVDDNSKALHAGPKLGEDYTPENGGAQVRTVCR